MIRTLVDGNTVVRVHLDTEGGALHISAKARNEPWSMATVLSCKGWAPDTVRRFCGFAESLIGIELMETVEELMAESN